MAEPVKKDQPIVRYSDLARSPANSQRSIDPSTHDHTPGEIAFREATQLKSLARSDASRIITSDVVVDPKAVQLFEQILKDVKVVYDAVRSGQTFRLDRIFGLAQAIVDYPDTDRLLYQVFEAQQQVYQPYLNSAHCTILAVQIARGMGHQRDELVQLTVASLVHDIGTQKLSQELLDKPGKLSKEEFAAVQTHPEVGYKLLMQYSPQHTWLAKIVRDEHERENGQGYPHGLHSEEIHDLAKVIGVADIYDALTSPRPYRRIFSPHEAVQELLDCQEHLGYSRPVVRALIQQLSLFPVGCWVRLSSQEIGRVVQSNSRSPLRPVVEVLHDSAGQPLASPRCVDLNTNPLLYIVSSLPLEAPASASSTNGRHE
ncbi:MAG: HD domain-containing protein [Nitrospirae bacterium]|nr:HD domain-containing protein [Nitrospirota bacterium]